MHPALSERTCRCLSPLLSTSWSAQQSHRIERKGNHQTYFAGRQWWGRLQYLQWDFSQVFDYKISMSCPLSLTNTSFNPTLLHISRFPKPFLAIMKNFAAISAAFFALVASSYALPTAEATAEALPAGYEPITRDEILRRLDTSSAASSLEKRTPGGVRWPVDRYCSMNADVIDLPMYWKQLYRSLRLQGPAFQYLHSPHGSLVSLEFFPRLPNSL